MEIRVLKPQKVSSRKAKRSEDKRKSHKRIRSESLVSRLGKGFRFRKIAGKWKPVKDSKKIKKLKQVN